MEFSALFIFLQGKNGTRDSERCEAVVEPLRPARGGFLRPFSTTWFIIEYLKGNGPQGSLKIGPDVGAPQVDIHRAYKEALHRVWAEDMVARDERRAAKEGTASTYYRGG